MFRELEHMADIALEVTANTLEELFNEAAYGMMAVLYGSEEISRHLDITVTVTVDGCDVETRLVSFLSELLYHNETTRLIVTDCRVSFRNDTVIAHVQGYNGEAPTKEIKAVTFHGMEINTSDKGYTTTIVFDV